MFLVTIGVVGLDKSVVVVRRSGLGLTLKNSDGLPVLSKPSSEGLEVTKTIIKIKIITFN